MTQSSPIFDYFSQAIVTPEPFSYPFEAYSEAESWLIMDMNYSRTYVRNVISNPEIEYNLGFPGCALTSYKAESVRFLLDRILWICVSVYLGSLIIYSHI